MKFLAFIFVVLTLIGLCIGQAGASLMAAMMVAVVLYGEQQLNKRDAEFEAAKEASMDKHDVMHCLQQHDCECARSTF
jgi:hypothetical protein